MLPLKWHYYNILLTAFIALFSYSYEYCDITSMLAGVSGVAKDAMLQVAISNIFQHALIPLCTISASLFLIMLLKVKTSAQATNFMRE